MTSAAGDGRLDAAHDDVIPNDSDGAIWLTAARPNPAARTCNAHKAVHVESTPRMQVAKRVRIDLKSPG